MVTVIQFLSIFLTVYTLCLFAWALLSWLPMLSPGLAFNSTVVSIRGFLDSIILPYVKLFKFVPPVRMGNAMLDLSALVAMLVLIIGGPILLGLLATVLGVGAS